jgi:hypothetical protein
MRFFSKYLNSQLIFRWLILAENYVDKTGKLSEH